MTNMLNKLYTYIFPGLAFWHLWDGGRAHLAGDTQKALIFLLLSILFMLMEIARLLREYLILRRG